MNGPVSPSPLTEQDYQRIQKHLADLARLQQEIQQAAAAGCDVTEPSSDCHYLLEQLQKIKRVYFPNKP